MSYKDDLKDRRWQKRRLEIMARDRFICQVCRAEDNATLNVHHIKYKKGAKVWEYDDDDLITLCEYHHLIVGTIEVSNIVNKWVERRKIIKFWREKAEKYPEAFFILDWDADPLLIVQRSDPTPTFRQLKVGNCCMIIPNIQVDYP